MKKILLVSGCSNTEKDFYSEIHPTLDTTWPKWPELLAEKLDMDCVNLAKSGAGNEYIYTSLLEYIAKHKNNTNIGLVIPAWTQCNRKDFSRGWNMRWTNERIDPSGDVFSWMRRTLNFYVSLQILCEKYNLNYLHIQMLSPYQDWLNGLRPRDLDPILEERPNFRYTYPGDVEKDNKKIIKIIDSYEGVINTKRFLGWPLSHEFGGFCLQKKLINTKDNTKISDLDSHPNEKGHQVLAEEIYARLG